MCADLLIGAGCVAEVEIERGVARRSGPRAALHRRRSRRISSRMTDATCPAIHTALQATEKGVPFMPLRGVLGSDLVKEPQGLEGGPRSVFRRADPSRAGHPAGRRAVPRALGRRGRQRLGRPAAELATDRACRRSRPSSPSKRQKAGDMLEDELLAPGVISRDLRHRRRAGAARRLAARHRRRLRHRRRAPRALREGGEDARRLRAYLDEFVLYAKEELLACVIARLIGGARHVAVGAASPIPATGRFPVQAEQPVPAGIDAAQAQGQSVHRGLARAVRPRRPGPHRRLLPRRRADRRRGAASTWCAPRAGASPARSARPSCTRWCRSTILFREEHSRRTLVPKVEFVSARGDPRALLTGKALFSLAEGQAPLPAGERASGAYGRRSAKRHRLRF